MTTMRASIAVIAATLCMLAAATSAEDDERARLGQERAAIDAQYNARQSECSRRFVVTSCIEDAKRDRRRALDGLRSRQIVLDESRRKERSAARSAELSSHAAEEARREAARPGRAASSASEAGARHDEAVKSPEPRHAAPESVRPKSRSPGASGPASSARSTVAAERAAREGRSRATFEARQQHAAEHREEVVDKATKRIQQHPPAPALPMPAP